jgi:hypothetical protein
VPAVPASSAVAAVAIDRTIGIERHDFEDDDHDDDDDDDDADAAAAIIDVSVYTS